MRKKVCIVQARMGSTRLPGKVLLPLCGKPLLLHVIDRVLQSKKLDEVVVATTTEERDDVIAELISGYHPKVFIERGSENDVLDRYYQTAKKHSADIVIRATSDNPFFDPDIMDKMIKVLEADEDLDYISNSIQKHTFPRGLDVEVLTFKTLEKCWKEGKEDIDREHVTVYIKRSPEKFKTQSFENQTDLSHYRLTVDEENDYKLTQTLYEKLLRLNPKFRMEDVVALLDNEPSLSKINQHVKQKNPQY